MVKNRNFQVRVEESVARRKQAKERKKRSEDRRQYKALAHSCLKQLDALMASHPLVSLLEECASASNTASRQQEQAPVVVTLHLWTDQRGRGQGPFTASNSNKEDSSKPPATLDDSVASFDGGEEGDGPMDASESQATSRRSSTSTSTSNLVGTGTGVGAGKQNRGKKGRNRSVSLGNQRDEIHNQTHTSSSLDTIPDCSTPSKPKGRLRSNSVPEKCHPASSYKQQQQQQQQLQQSQEETNHPLCCRADFFRATCSMSNTTTASRKKASASCRYIHYNKHMAWHEHEHEHSSSSSLHHSLHQVVVGQSNNNNNSKNDHPANNNLGTWEHELFLSEQAAAASLPEHLQESDPFAIKMVYHYQLPVVLNSSVDDNKNLSSKLCALLQEHNLSLSNMVYLCLGSAFVYDRYRDGWLCSSCHYDQDDLLLRVFHNNSSSSNPHTSSSNTPTKTNHPAVAAAGILRMRRKESIGGSEYSDEDLRNVVLQLPGIVLEHVLTFLPDSAVAVVSQVCRAWNLEIGQNSPHLWRQLLERRQWPLPLLSSSSSSSLLLLDSPAQAPTQKQTNDHDVIVSASASANNNDEKDAHTTSVFCAEERIKTETELYRDAFTNHYTVVRNVNALKHGVAAIMKKQHVVEDENVMEVAFQNFLSRKHAPDSESHRAVQVWSPNRTLVAYRADCSLRLFEAVVTPINTSSECSNNGSGSSASRLLCKEVVCQRVDLCPYTKKKKCTLRTMALDEQYIVSLCREYEFDTDMERSILVVMTREAFLVGGENNKAPVLASEQNYSLIDVGDTVLECAIQNPDAFDPHRILGILDYLNDGGELRDIRVYVSDYIGCFGCGLFLLEMFITFPANHITLGRKIVLFSVELGAIVWVGDSILAGRLPYENVQISCYRKPSLDGRTSSCIFAIAWPSSSNMFIGKVGLGGDTFYIKSIHVTESEREEFDAAGWIHMSRLIATTPTDIVAVDSWTKSGVRKCLVSFYRFCPFKNDWDCTTLTLDGNVTALNVTCLDDNHVLIVGYRYFHPPGVQEDEPNEVRLAEGAEDRNDEAGPNENNNNEGVVFGEVPAPDPMIWPRADLVAIVLDIASRQEIYRDCWWSDLEYNDDWTIRYLPRMEAAASTGGGTLALGLSGKGIVMTGQDVRDRLASSPGCFSPRSSPKKKKGKAPRSSMKDGLVRGKRMYF